MTNYEIKNVIQRQSVGTYGESCSPKAYNVLDSQCAHRKLTRLTTLEFLLSNSVPSVGLCQILLQVQYPNLAIPNLAIPNLVISNLVIPNLVIPTTYQLLANYLPTLHQLLANYLPTTCQLLVLRNFP